MKMTHCEYEQQVAAALSEGELNGELREHATRCEICQAVAYVSNSLLALADASLRGPELPTASQVWRRSHQQQITSEVKLRRALLVCRVIGYLALGLGIAGWLVLNWQQVKPALEQFSISFRNAENPGPIVRPLVYVTIVLLAMNSILTFWRFRRTRTIKT